MSAGELTNGVINTSFLMLYKVCEEDSSSVPLPTYLLVMYSA